MDISRIYKYVLMPLVGAKGYFFQNLGKKYSNVPLFYPYTNIAIVFLAPGFRRRKNKCKKLKVFLRNFQITIWILLKLTSASEVSKLPNNMSLLKPNTWYIFLDLGIVLVAKDANCFHRISFFYLKTPNICLLFFSLKGGTIIIFFFI